MQTTLDIPTPNDLYAQLKSWGCLADYGFSEADVPEATTRIIEVAPVSNPVKVTPENINALLSDALYGATPNLPGSSTVDCSSKAPVRREPRRCNSSRLTP